MGLKECTNLWPVDILSSMIDLPPIEKQASGKLAGGNWKWNPVTQANVKTGMKVKRGKDWSYNDQDNNGYGEVVGIGPIHFKGAEVNKGGCVVQWNDGSENFYKIGIHNMFDLDIVNSNINLKTSKNGKSLEVSRGITEIRKGTRRFYAGLQSRNGGTISKGCNK